MKARRWGDISMPMERAKQQNLIKAFKVLKRIHRTNQRAVHIIQATDGEELVEDRGGLDFFL